MTTKPFSFRETYLFLIFSVIWRILKLNFSFFTKMFNPKVSFRLKFSSIIKKNI